MNAPEKVLKPKSLAAAFVAAQKGFAPALKQSNNPHFKSKYVDLAGCVEAVIDSLNANGIALIQKTHPCDDGVIVETIFVHESGEEMSGGILHVPASKQDAQGFGSALTYARRYSLMAATGIAPEDDDGNAASKRVEPPSKAALDSMLEQYRAESLKGMEALKAFHMKPGSSEAKAQVWNAHKDNLKQAAAAADSAKVGEPS